MNLREYEIHSQPLSLSQCLTSAVAYQQQDVSPNHPCLDQRGSMGDKMLRRNNWSRIHTEFGVTMRFKVMKALLAAALLLPFGSGLARADGNPAKGKRDFNMICSACHTVKPGENRTGPTLYGVIGRKAGSVPSFHYSPGLAKASFIWTPEKVEDWLKGPGHLIPGTFMTVSIASDAERDDIVAYLAQESAQAHKDQSK